MGWILPLHEPYLFKLCVTWEPSYGGKTEGNSERFHHTAQNLAI